MQGNTKSQSGCNSLWEHLQTKSIDFYFSLCDLNFYKPYGPGTRPTVRLEPTLRPSCVSNLIDSLPHSHKQLKN